MSRTEFSKRVKLAAWDRSRGQCEACGVKIRAGMGPHYDHVRPTFFNDDASLENCAVLCKTCHASKTTDQDRPAIDRARRLHEKAIGAREKRSRPLPGSKASGWRKKMDGTVERR